MDRIRTLQTSDCGRWGYSFSFHYQRLSIVSICQRTPLPTIRYTTDGLSLGEACGAVLLETQGNANHIILSGGAISNDANHISGPSRTGDGLALAINQAMEEAGALPKTLALSMHTEQLRFTMMKWNPKPYIWRD